MINSSNGSSDNKKKPLHRIKNQLTILIKNDLRRFLLSVVITLFCIFLLTSFLTTWNSTKTVSFLDFVEENEEHQISAFYSTVKDGYVPSYDQNYLEDLTLEIQETMNELYPNVISEKIIGMMSIEFYSNLVTQTDFHHTEFRTTTAELLPILNQSLVTGRLPANNAEILYFQKQNISTYNLNDEISIRTLRVPNTFAKNFTIVGILGPLVPHLESSGYSSNCVNWQENLNEYRYIFSANEIFYTNNEDFFSTINSFPVINAGRAMIVDFMYDYSAINVQRISMYLSQHQDLLQTDVHFSSEQSESITLCKDIFSTLQGFNYFWIYETIKSILLLTPALLLLFFVSIEINKSGQTEFENITFKMKLQGLSNRTIKNLLLIKGVFVVLLSLIVGIIVGTFVGLALTKIIGLRVTIQTILEYLLEPFYLLILALITFVLFIGMIIAENRIVRKTSVMKSKPETKAFSKKKRVWLTPHELVLLATGITMLLPGVLLATIVPLERLTATSISYDLSSLITLIAWVFIIVGALVTINGLFYIVARCILAQFNKIGERRWYENKNRLSYALKNLITNKENYQRVIVITLIASIGLLPGAILPPSMNRQIALERDMSVGCADLLIENWDNYTLPQREIEQIVGVQQTTTVTIVTINFEASFDFGHNVIYTILILAIHNCKHFNQVVDLSRLGKIQYSEEDIEKLSRNLTYLMNKEHVKNYGYDDPDRILYNSFFGETIERYPLEYVKSFDYFPLLPLVADASTPFQQSISFQLVTSLQTVQLLESVTTSATYSERDYLLLRTTAEGNLTSITSEITNIYNWSSIITTESVEKELDQTTNSFTSIFSIICSVIVASIIFFYGYITAVTIYNRRKRIIETEYRLGIDRNQIWQGMVLEIILITAGPVLISTMASCLFLLLLKQLIPIQQIYHSFNLWLPWWLLILITLLSECLIVGGNAASLIPQVKNYRPIKVE